MPYDHAVALALLLDERMKQTQPRPVLELGEIQGNKGLALDRCQEVLPPGEYYVFDTWATLHLPGVRYQGSITHPVDEDGRPLPDSKSHSCSLSLQAKDIEQVRLEPKAALKTGDKVLVAWVNDHKDAVVLCKVAKGRE